MRQLHLTTIFFILLTMLSSTTFAVQDEKERTVRLSVEGMTCVTCPLTVKFALKQINGVTFADSDYETASAIVSFDPKKTNIKALTDATTNAGYPSKFKEEIKQ